MAVVNCILDAAVHRTFNFTQPITANGVFPQFNFLQVPVSAAYPSGHKLEIIFAAGGTPFDVQCENVKTPQNRDVQICAATPCTGIQYLKPVDDSQYRVYVVGKELSTAPGVSFMIVSQKNITNGTVSEMVVYSDTNGNNLVVSATGGGSKIPPNLG